MDETACWMDMPGDSTIHFTGSRSVSLKTTGHEKQHYTVVLTARADGTKLKPFVVFKGKGTRLIKELSTIPGVVVRFSSNGWMNDDLTIEYLKSVIGRLSFQKHQMIWDACRCHCSKTVKAECNRLRLHTATVAGGCTKFIQAANVVWNAPFKSRIKELYETWMSDISNHQYTKGGNLKTPSRSIVCEWIRSAWSDIPQLNFFLNFQVCISFHLFKNEKHPLEAFEYRY
jgi:hypothetical protein